MYEEEEEEEEEEDMKDNNNNQQRQRFINYDTVVNNEGDMRRRRHGTIRHCSFMFEWANKFL
jgi:hypothetical protein|tara:strand:+ start:312 stop:497 length:186 start_codon:yes stop_codon:yes gene_type:complete